MRMIRVTRINHVPLVLNSDLIEHVETTPDTVISLTTGHKFVVLESADEVVRRVVAFRREICPSAICLSRRTAGTNHSWREQIQRARRKPNQRSQARARI